MTSGSTIKQVVFLSLIILFPVGSQLFAYEGMVCKPVEKTGIAGWSIHEVPNDSKRNTYSLELKITDQGPNFSEVFFAYEAPSSQPYVLNSKEGDQVLGFLTVRSSAEYEVKRLKDRDALPAPSAIFHLFKSPRNSGYGVKSSGVLHILEWNDIRNVDVPLTCTHTAYPETVDYAEKFEKAALEYNSLLKDLGVSDESIFIKTKAVEKNEEIPSTEESPIKRLFCELTERVGEVLEFFYIESLSTGEDRDPDFVGYFYRGSLETHQMIRVPLRVSSVQNPEHPWFKDAPNGVILAATRESNLYPSKGAPKDTIDYVIQYNADGSLIYGPGDDDATLQREWKSGNARYFTWEAYGENKHSISALNCIETKLTKEQIEKEIHDSLKN